MKGGRYIREVLLDKPVSKGSYLYDLPAVRYLRENGSLTLDSDVTFFVGENGSGKSTLLEAIAVAFGFNPEGGTRNFRFSTAASHSELYAHITLAKPGYPKDGFFLRAESFYNAASYIDKIDREPAFQPPVINSYGGVSLHKQSHGESFMSLVQNRFRGDGLYILDEPGRPVPEPAADPPGRDKRPGQTQFPIHHIPPLAHSHGLSAGGDICIFRQGAAIGFLQADRALPNHQKVFGKP